MDEVTTSEEEGFPIPLRPFVEKGFEQLMDGVNRLPDVDIVVHCTSITISLESAEVTLTV